MANAGVSWTHPLTDEIPILTAQGDPLVAASVTTALEAFNAGARLQLWLDLTDVLVIGQADHHVRMYFDGLTARDVARCLDALQSSGVDYRVCTE